MSFPDYEFGYALTSQVQTSRQLLVLLTVRLPHRMSASTFLVAQQSFFHAFLRKCFGFIFRRSVLQFFVQFFDISHSSHRS